MLIGLLILLLALVSSWLSRESQRDATKPPPSAAALPDYFINGLTLTALGADGVPRHRLRAERLVHYPDDGRTELRQPRFELLVTSGPSWQVSAELGEMPADHSRIDFTGQVRIERIDSLQNPLALDTQQLTVWPQRGLAQSDASISIETSDTLLQADGLRIDFNQRTLVLLDNIRGRYEPTSD